MHKKLKASFSIEASFVMPIILTLYVLIILTALFLYCRCVISQDMFLLCNRGSSFSYGESGYGEVIYGENKGMEDYVSERLKSRQRVYPFYSYEGGTITIYEDRAVIQVKQKKAENFMKKQTQRINPVSLIREGRKEAYAAG